MNNDELQLRLEEFKRHVWDHTKDAFQAQFDERRPLTKEEASLVGEAARLTRKINDDQELGVSLLDSVIGSPEALLTLLQICGLTRNKMLNDLKVAASKQSPPVKFPSSYKSLVRSKSKEARNLAGAYLGSRIKRVLGALSAKHFPAAAEALNQATWPGYIRQERAKRSGHEGEYRLATLLAGCNIPFEPIEKADNPLCRDAQVYGESFDLVVPNKSAPLVCFKATVHTANIGQFGESKDHLEIDGARRMLDARFDERSRPLLVAFVDGVGFFSNRAGLRGVLSKADEFCQYDTLWKAAMICAAKINAPLKIELPRAMIEEFRRFIARYKFAKSVVAKEDEYEARLRLPAGGGFILLEHLPSE